MAEKILIVEDDLANQRVASLFLKKLGHDSDIASNGAEGVEMATQTRYSLIIMDCQMPVVDGFTAARQIREQQGPNQDTPIIALTANVVSGIDDDCRASGMNDLLHKPVRLQEVSDILKRWLA